MIWKCGVTDYVTFFITYASACKFSMFGGFFVGRSLNTVMSEIQYALPYNRLGYFSASIWETYKHSKYVDSTSPFFQKTNNFGGMFYGGAANVSFHGSWRWVPVGIMRHT